jgi:hypothetical protein
MKFCILIDLQRMNNLYVKNEKYKHGSSWYLRLTYCFMVTTHKPFNLDKQSFVQWKIVDIHASFIWIITFFNGPFEYGDDEIFKLLRWMQNLHQSTWDHKILYAAQIFRGWTTFNKSTFARIQNMNMADSWKLKFTFYFMERSYELLH